MNFSTQVDPFCVYFVQGVALQQGLLNAVRQTTAEDFHSMDLVTVTLSAVPVVTAALTSNTSAPVSPCRSK